MSEDTITITKKELDERISRARADGYKEGYEEGYEERVNEQI